MALIRGKYQELFTNTRSLQDTGKQQDLTPCCACCDPLLHYLKLIPGDINIKQIDFFNSENDKPTSILLNPNGCKTIRVYNEYLSKQSYEMIFDASEIVGVSGDNTLEQSVAHQVLPFYHSTNSHMKHPTWRAIKEMIQTTDFGFSEELKQDLLVYFGYAGLDSRLDYWKKLFSIDLNSTGSHRGLTKFSL